MTHVPAGVNAQPGRTVTIRFVGGPLHGQARPEPALCHRIRVSIMPAAMAPVAQHIAKDTPCEALASALLDTADPYWSCASRFRTAVYERPPGSNEARFIGVEPRRHPERIREWAQRFNWSPQRLEAALTTEWTPHA